MKKLYKRYWDTETRLQRQGNIFAIVMHILIPAFILSLLITLCIVLIPKITISVFILLFTYGIYHYIKTLKDL